MKTRLIPADKAVTEAVEILRRGDVVALPTETVYGLGADALSSRACAKIFEAKDRPLNDPLIVHVPDRDWLEKLAVMSLGARELAEAFWPGPLTLVLPRRELVPDLVTAGQSTVAVRWSAHPVFQAIVSAWGRPIAAPSANRFGRISPTRAEHVKSELTGRIPLIVDGGPCEHGIESTIVLVHQEGLEVLRHGPMTTEQLGAFGKILPRRTSLAVPGNLKSHYAPRTPLQIFDEKRDYPVSCGLLAWSHSGKGFAKVEYLSVSQDFHEAAANLYGAMRRLDEAGLDLILAEPLPEQGLGVAIMERLRRAAARE